MRKIIATTDVLAHENRFPKGTGFHVVDTPDPKAKPPQIDRATAEVWGRNGWAEAATEKAST
ncbi:hypothetical protein [Devosia sp. Root635]|uniref:hypothetical protein n=1 Tax=Devosia sp. Root635 TaxID=1736575 RepID=UPI0006FEE721|nr:hypothetical protein [Devosia sp. Root635]KRA44695.1 hypothetical protein ASD80_06015 [Devosia sp. Root635]